MCVGGGGGWGGGRGDLLLSSDLNFHGLSFLEVQAVGFKVMFQFFADTFKVFP